MDAIGTGETLDTDPMCRELGERVRYFRHLQGISQEELAYRSGLHRTYIGALERGEKNAGLTNIFKVAHGLGVEPWELFNEEK